MKNTDRISYRHYFRDGSVESGVFRFPYDEDKVCSCVERMFAAVGGGHITIFDADGDVMMECYNTSLDTDLQKAERAYRLAEIANDNARRKFGYDSEEAHSTRVAMMNAFRTREALRNA